jgi:hypothetical protein
METDREKFMRQWLDEKRIILEAEQTIELAEARLDEITEQLAPLLENNTGEIVEGLLWRVQEKISLSRTYDKENNESACTFYEKYPEFTKTYRMVDRKKILESVAAGHEFTNLNIVRTKKITTKAPN